jgi:hypothetical protein
MQINACGNLKELCESKAFFLLRYFFNTVKQNSHACGFKSLGVIVAIGIIFYEAENKEAELFWCIFFCEPRAFPQAQVIFKEGNPFLTGFYKPG